MNSLNYCRGWTLPHINHIPYMLMHTHNRGLVLLRPALVALYKYNVLNVVWSIRIFILMTGRNVEQTKDVRMYIEEFILVEIWVHCCTKLN